LGDKKTFGRRGVREKKIERVDHEGGKQVAEREKTLATPIQGESQRGKPLMEEEKKETSPQGLTRV